MLNAACCVLCAVLVLHYAWRESVAPLGLFVACAPSTVVPNKRALFSILLVTNIYHQNQDAMGTWKVPLGAHWDGGGARTLEEVLARGGKSQVKKKRKKKERKQVEEGAAGEAQGQEGERRSASGAKTMKKRRMRMPWGWG